MIKVTDARDPRTIKQQELAAAEQAKQSALLEYVAIMADVELPTDESEMSSDE